MERKYTDKDIVLAQREGFRAGAFHIRDTYGMQKGSVMQSADAARAVKVFPTPKVTRPRHVQGNSALSYHMEDDRLYGTSTMGVGQGQVHRLVTIPFQDATIVADLMKNPTVTVEAF